MPEPATLRLQRSLAALALAARVPETPVVEGFQEDLLVYRELVRSSLTAPVAAT